MRLIGRKRGIEAKRALVVVALLALTALPGCQIGGDGTGATGTTTEPAPLALTPMCSVFCEVATAGVGAYNGRAFVADRTSTNSGNANFTPFRAMLGPRGNPGIGANTTGIPDVYAVREAWQRLPGTPTVFRGLATPAPRTGQTGPDNFGSGWQIYTQDPFGLWRGPFGNIGSSPGRSVGSANDGREVDTPESGALYVPQMMPVGILNAQMYACAGGRTQDGRARTTWLLEAIAPNPTVSSGITFIQDVLFGDDYFKPSTSGPLMGPTTPPTPRVSGPQALTGDGSVLCAIRQDQDDLRTRELHMLTLGSGKLFHSVSSNWGPVTTESGTTFSRFRTTTPWTAVGAALGTTTSAAIVAHPTGVSVFFVAAAGGVYRLWHTVRLSSSGTWLPAKDVLALSGDAPAGHVRQFSVAAGVCPAYGTQFWTASTTETLIVVWFRNPMQVLAIRQVTTPRDWGVGRAPSVYSNWQNIPLGELTAGPQSFLLRGVAVAARPFRDDSMPVPPG